MTDIAYDSNSGKLTAGEREITPIELFDAAGKIAHVETGLLPPGLLSFRQSGGITQIALQTAPRIHTFGWTNYEGGTPVWYELAMPWRVLLGTYGPENNLIGARIFYSPTPIYTMDDKLYLPNIPNTNCRGYGVGYVTGENGKNGLGWVCLYPSGDSERPVSVAQKMRHLVDRCSGGGVYNDANMSNTDGTRVYKEYFPDRKYLWDPKAWQERSAAEGVDWICNPANLILAKVRGIDAQNMHVKDMVPLSIGMALVGDTMWYYKEGDETRLKPYNLTEQPAEDPGYGLLKKVKVFFTGLENPYKFNHAAHDVNFEKLRADIAVPDSETNIELVEEPAKPPAKKAPAKKKAAAKKAPAKKKAPIKKAAAKKTPATAKAGTTL